MTGNTPQHEPQRFLGIKREPGHSPLRIDPTEPRVGGLPRSWFRSDPVDLTGLRHPIRWAKDRRDARRNLGG